jgi:serine protease Do
MAVQTRDWLKFVSLLGIAFILGLVFASALDLPRESRAASTSSLQTPAAARTPLPALPASVAPAAALGDAFNAVAEHVKPAVVFIRSERRERDVARRLPRGFEEFFRMPQRPPVQQGTGSGFVVSADGYILTNNHVVAEASRVTVKLLDKREFAARVVGADPATDVAVIKIEAKDLTTVDFANSDSTRIGEWVLAIGNPLGEAFTFSVTAGIVSAKGRLLRGLEQVPQYSIQDFIQTDAAINPGNSGGPLVNIRGQVVGINSAIASETGFYAGYGFAIPINLVRVVMDQLVETGHVRRAVIGVSIRDATAEDAEVVGLREIRGVTVHDFTNDGSPAKRAGIERGDVIVALDGQPVEYTAQLQQRVGFKKPGEMVEVTVLRKGNARRTFRVRLDEAPPEQLAGRDDATAEPTEGRGRGGTADPTLGISVEPLSQEEAAGRDLDAVRDAGGGLLVTDVSSDGPAYGRLFIPTAQPGGGADVILKVDDKPVRSRADLQTALRGAKGGDIVTLLVYNTGGGGSHRVVRIRIP